MKLKKNWGIYLHELRAREVSVIFKGCHDKCFCDAIELGAGDGFQSRLLVKYVKNLVCTELNENRLQKSPLEKVTYRICDAEEVGSCFPTRSFDMVYSSNLLEHLKERGRTLRQMHDILRDDGVCINVVPSVFMKFCWLSFFYPNMCTELLEVLSRKDGFKKVSEFMLKNLGSRKSQHLLGSQPLGNNPKRTPVNKIKQCLMPLPHGEYNTNLEELMAYRKKEWIRLIEGQGFEVAFTLKMPVVSGYGFGLDCFRLPLEKLGFYSSYAFIAFKKGALSPYRKYWSG